MEDKEEVLTAEYGQREERRKLTLEFISVIMRLLATAGSTQSEAYDPRPDWVPAESRVLRTRKESPLALHFETQSSGLSRSNTTHTLGHATAIAMRPTLQLLKRSVWKGLPIRTLLSSTTS